MSWYMAVLKKYAVFTGRARRKEFWMFYLFYIIISIVLSIIDGMAGLSIGNQGLLTSLYGLALFIPSLAVSVRRLHDTNRSGWWLLIAFTVIGIIPLIVFYATEGNPAENQYGANPKLASAA